MEEVPARAADAMALAGRLLADGVELVIMESTSHYWRMCPVADPAGRDGPAASLVHPTSGGPVLRDLSRTLLQLVRDRTREWQRLEKLLEGVLVKLSSAVWSLVQSVTARAVLEALVGGERDPKALAAPAAPQVRGGRAAIEQALEGMQLSSHHPMLVRGHPDRITLLDRQAAAVEDETEAALAAIPASWGITADGVPDPVPGPDAAALNAAAGSQVPASAIPPLARSSPRPGWT